MNYYLYQHDWLKYNRLLSKSNLILSFQSKPYFIFLSGAGFTLFGIKWQKWNYLYNFSFIFIHSEYIMKSM